MQINSRPDSVKKLLEYYSKNVAEAIAALLEDNLPPALSDLNRYEEDKSVEKVKPKDTIPNLYHKKAGKKRDEIGNREEQIYVNAVARKYKYIDDEEDEIEDENGVKYSTKGSLIFTAIKSDA